MSHLLFALALLSLIVMGWFHHESRTRGLVPQLGVTRQWTSRKSLLSLGLLLVASGFGGATWSQSHSAGHQAAQPPDIIKQISHEATAQPDAATKGRLK